MHAAPDAGAEEVEVPVTEQPPGVGGALDDGEGAVPRVRPQPRLERDYGLPWPLHALEEVGFSHVKPYLNQILSEAVKTELVECARHAPAALCGDWTDPNGRNPKAEQFG